METKPMTESEVYSKGFRDGRVHQIELDHMEKMSELNKEFKDKMEGL